MDIFELTINPENSNQYLLDDRWESFEIEEDYLAFKTFWFFEITYKAKI